MIRVLSGVSGFSLFTAGVLVDNPLIAILLACAAAGALAVSLGCFEDDDTDPPGAPAGP